MNGGVASTRYACCERTNVGYDATGRVRNSSELGDAACNLKAFLDKEGW